MQGIRRTVKFGLPLVGMLVAFGGAIYVQEDLPPAFRGAYRHSPHRGRSLEPRQPRSCRPLADTCCSEPRLRPSCPEYPTSTQPRSMLAPPRTPQIGSAIGLFSRRCTRRLTEWVPRQAKRQVCPILDRLRPKARIGLEQTILSVGRRTHAESNRSRP